jgi:sodium pump decarboxylase gamma subunit
MLMILGMGVVFIFLILLIIYMKSVPMLSQITIFSRFRRDTRTQGKNLKLKSVLTPHSGQQQGKHDSESVSDLEIAAIAAAIYSQTGKEPQKIVITGPTGATTRINIWGTAGRQDLMQSRDVVGQVGFQY